MSEKLPMRKKEVAPPIQDVEDVLHAFAETREEYRTPVETEPERVAAFQRLNKTLERFENQEMTNMYDEGRVPTFQSIELACTRALSALSTVEDPEAQRIAKLLSERMSLIKRWSRSYVVSILRFRNSKISMQRMNDDDQREAFRRSDTDRRRAHDALLESLASVNTLIEEASEYAEFEKP